jgi:cytochrome P450
MLNSGLLPEENTVTRLFQEAQVIIGAAILTTSWALAVASFHIINTPEIFEKLRTELITAIPNATAPLNWTQLEQLPYLTGCVKEGIRLAYGIASRLPRVAHKDLQYKDWTIPASTPISMTIVDMNHAEAVFPNSFEFNPERWMRNPKTMSGAPLDRYFVGFGKGSRSCLGLHLAQAELYMGLAAIFRRFTFELYQTDVSDTLLAHDYFVPTVKLDSKGIMVKVKSVDA